MVDINNLIAYVKTHCLEMKTNDTMIISTFKKDRHLSLIKLDNDLWSFESSGFTHEVIFNLSFNELLKLVKKYKDKEFPCSNKVYVCIRKKK